FPFLEGAADRIDGEQDDVAACAPTIERLVDRYGSQACHLIASLRLARDLVRFPGSGDAENDTTRHSKDSFDYPIDHRLNDLSTGRGPSDEEVFLDRQPLWFKLAAAAALLYAAYLPVSGERAQRIKTPRMSDREVLLIAVAIFAEDAPHNEKAGSRWQA